MYEKTAMMFIYVETPLHAGSGRGLGAVDLPIQRERITGYPIIQASSVKGKLRAEVRAANGWKDDTPEIEALFGKAGDAGDNFAGAIAPGDARILLFPVRSLAGVFAWTTCLHVLQRFARDCALAGMRPPVLDGLSSPSPSQALIGKSSVLKAGDVAVLEEFSYTLNEEQKVTELGKWLAEHALPSEYTYWRSELPKKLIILPDDDFRDFALYATEVQTHVRLNPDTKTVQTGALWTTESLPTDTLLYAPLMLMKPRQQRDDQQAKDVNDVLTTVKNALDGKHIQFGGDETTGQGWVVVKFAFAGGQS
ncbi:MAG: type III-B CRISPR module RAMP protein Cmr4 [Chloroflexi bacterium]|nr:type III-B CRISPR module RAMP protein Cmr4 [Chloroflexota bacterium]